MPGPEVKDIATDEVAEVEQQDEESFELSPLIEISETLPAVENLTRGCSGCR
jgi:hypothetical protein